MGKENPVKVSEANPKKSRGRPTSVCGVCGDQAKHIHFGGLCCPSCKAFFRRVVQLNLKDTISCSLSGNCQITVKNRRDCPPCRFKKCESIGMLLTWVMPAEERKRMMERRSVACKRIMERIDEESESNSPQSEETPTEVKGEKASQKVDLLKGPETEGSKDENNRPNVDIPSCPKKLKIKTVTEPIRENCVPPESAAAVVIKQEIKSEVDEELEVSLLIVPEELKKLSLSLSAAFQRFEFPEELPLDKPEKFGQLFFSYCKTLSSFFSDLEDLNVLNLSEKSRMLKQAVTKSIFIYAAHQYDSSSYSFPRSRFSPNCSFPTVHLRHVERFLCDENVLVKIERFLNLYSSTLSDECVTLYLMVIDFLSPPEGEEVSEAAVQLKHEYVRRLENYLSPRQDRINFVKPLPFYFDALLDVHKLAKEFGELKLPADKLKTECSLPSVPIKLEKEDEREIETPRTEPMVLPSIETSIARTDHDYSISVANLAETIMNQQKCHSEEFISIKKEPVPLRHTHCRSKHRHHVYKRPLEPCARRCCVPSAFCRKPTPPGDIIKHPPVDYETTCPSEYMRHGGSCHRAEFGALHHIPDPHYNGCFPTVVAPYLPSHLTRMEEDSVRSPHKCYRNCQCCSPPPPPLLPLHYQRYDEPLWKSKNYPPSHPHRWPHHHHSSESRDCCHIPWNR